MNEHDRPLAPAETAATNDKNIDFSEIPELDDNFWQQAELVGPDLTEQVTLRVKRSVLTCF